MPRRLDCSEHPTPIRAGATIAGDVAMDIPPEDLTEYSTKEVYSWIMTAEEAVGEAKKLLIAADLGDLYQVRLPLLSESSERPVLRVPAERARRLGLLLLHTVDQMEHGRHLN